ncbi:hypothetical protein GPJ56_001648 [Histomonas meleagridis]|uniref:uncharacterized protein n=1 Tax=Histomonas meleagridis TaxID=135588 RepID=UPI00355A7D5E|nr:hypothetical protein GPJ56_001648 [Histomonas meleagridis]KAH0796266.1 hypothetical protein GO595_010159 [Histomonas meleagridis]
MRKQPTCWEDILKEREAERNRPPPPEAYIRPEIHKYEEGGIFSKTEFDDSDKKNEVDDIPIDPSFYTTASMEGDDSQTKRRKFKKIQDHDDAFQWPKYTKYQRQTEKAPTCTTRRDLESRDFDVISGLSHKESNFKSTIKQILDKKETYKQFKLSRQIDPISNTFPTEELESTRKQQEEMLHTTKYIEHLHKLSPNEQRAHSNEFNIITSECTNDSYLKVINDFPNSSLQKAQLARKRETEYVTKREEEKNKTQQRVFQRFTNGREKEQRDYNIINGYTESRPLSANIREKPSVWQWCQSERLDA